MKPAFLFMALTALAQTACSQVADSVASPSGALAIPASNPLWGDYYFLPLSIAVIVLYSLTSILTRRGKISVLAHRRIWNVVLLLTFIICGITGLLIALRLDLRWDIPLPALLSFWHIETGIAMTLVSVFHAIWHWKYFAGILFPKSVKE